MRRFFAALVLPCALGGGCVFFTNVDGLRNPDGGIDATTDTQNSDAVANDVSDGGSNTDGPSDASKDAALVLFGCDAAPQLGLVGYYPLDEKSGNIVHDCSGFGNDGTLLGSPFAWTAAQIGGGLQLTGGDAGGVDFVSPSFDFGGTPTAMPFSVAMWINLTANAADGSRSYITGKSNNPDVAGWRVSVEPDLTLHLALPADGGSTIGTSTSLTLNTFFHVAIVYTSASTTIYVNGALNVTKAMPGGFPIDTTPGDHLRIGVSSDNQHYTRAVYDDVRYYTRALSLADVGKLYKGP